MDYKDKKTKAQRISEEISEKILHGEYKLGEKLPSEREMADRVGVSRDTVRQAYDTLEKTGLLKRIQGSGTHISNRISGYSGSIKAVAIICPDIDRFGLTFISALESALAERDTMMILKINKKPEDDDKVMLELMQKGINNIIIWASGCSELTSVCARLRALGANIVFFDRVLPGKYADFVGLDNKDAFVRILEHARERSAEVYTFLSLAGIVGDSTESRKVAFIEWCEANSYVYDLFVSDKNESDSDYIAEMLLNHKGDRSKRAYVCVNDHTALSLIEKCNELEMVYGIDGIATNNKYPIITVMQPFEEMARKTVELIFQQQQLGDKWKAKEVILKGELIE